MQPPSDRCAITRPYWRRFSKPWPSPLARFPGTRRLAATGPLRADLTPSSYAQDFGVDLQFAVDWASREDKEAILADCHRRGLRNQGGFMNVGFAAIAICCASANALKLTPAPPFA